MIATALQLLVGLSFLSRLTA